VLSGVKGFFSCDNIASFNHAAS